MNRDKVFDLPSEKDFFLVRVYKLTLVKIRKALGQYDKLGWEDEY